MSPPRTPSPPRLPGLTALGAALLLAAAPAWAQGQLSLNELEADVARDYQDVSHLTPEQLESAMRSPEKLLLLDARPDGEVGVSRLPGAIAVDPDIDSAAFLERFGALARGRDVVIYCSVGVRSSRLATRVRSALQARGAGRVANLRGGIFAWHNTGRPLQDVVGGTEWVHPYSSRWTYYLDFKELSRYEPRSGAARPPSPRPWSSYLPF
jgi:rhodanese-related sulfurtransferase